MSNFVIIKHGGTSYEVTGQTLRKWLADQRPVVLEDLLWDLQGDRVVAVELKDGPATVRRGELPKTPKTLPPEQLELPQPDDELPMQPMIANVMIQFMLPAKVRLLARSSDHVTETILDVVHGDCGIPKEFHFMIDPFEISALLGKMEVGDVTAMADVDVINSAPPYYKQLTYEET